VFARSNSAITVFKLVVPALAAITLIASGFHPENFFRRHQWRRAHDGPRGQC